MKNHGTLHRTIGIIAAALLALPAYMLAQGPPGGRGRGGPPPTPKAAAPVDFTGYWVSVVTEDWRWRMVTPITGDFASIPFNAEARKLGDAWDPAKDEAAGNQCRAYGAAAIMRVPGRVHITWADDNTLQIDTDAGTQTRLLHFDGKPPQGGEASLARIFGRAMGEASARIGLAAIRIGSHKGGRAGPVTRSGDHAIAPRLPAQERRTLQRQHGAQGVFRSVQGTQRRHVVRSDHGGRRSAVSD